MYCRRIIIQQLDILKKVFDKKRSKRRIIHFTKLNIKLYMLYMKKECGREKKYKPIIWTLLINMES